jgi:ubiquinone/menaquinone biosynthesis C-methylase UbiE
MAKLGRLEKKAMLSQRHAEEGVRKARELFDHVDMEGKRDYLELGCGGGHVTRCVASECGLACIGTDVDPEMVDIAKARSYGVKNVSFEEADATRLPFEDGSFDLVLSFGILHHIHDWQVAISEVSRVLRPGGHYVLGDIAYSRFSKALLGPFVRNYGVYTLEDLVGISSRSGLDLAWKERPRGTFLRYHALVLEKG